MSNFSPVPTETLHTLAANAEAADGQPCWPTASWDALRGAGVLSWCIPTQYGGQDRSITELLQGYEQLASACLTTCFLLSQREAACRRLRDSGNDRLCRELLPALASGERFATVGISQLTTSRQHVRPVLSARLTQDALLLDGYIPWVTGALRADHFVLGAVLDDGPQVLAVLPRQTAGVSVGAPLELMAVLGSNTAEIHCEKVRLERKWLLAGPAEQVMAGSGKGSAGGLETSSLALGLSGAALSHLHQEAAARPELRAIVDHLEEDRQRLRAELYGLAEGRPTGEEAAQLRGRTNALVLRSTQAALTASKGTGFVRGHPAQRWARQALFFLVWSCPRSATEATLAYLEGR